MYIITFVIVTAFIFSFHRDRRSFLNPALLMISIIFTYLSISRILYDFGYNSARHSLALSIFFGVQGMIVVGAIFLIFNGCILLKREGFSKTNLVSLFLGILVIAFYAVSFYYFTADTKAFNANPLPNILFVIAVYSYMIFCTAFISFLLYSFIYLTTPKKKIYDFIIIHGAGLRDGEYVTTLLKQRIDKAIEAFHNSSNPNIKIICSGGQGSDEKISEAKAMANYIASNAEVPMGRVILEEKSTTTYENLLFSKEIGEELVDKPKFLFVTNNYHVYRTSAYARKIKMDGDGLGCRTAGYYIPSAFIREFIAACVKIKWVFVALYAILFIFLFLL